MAVAREPAPAFKNNPSRMCISAKAYNTIIIRPSEEIASGLPKRHSYSVSLKTIRVVLYNNIITRTRMIIVRVAFPLPILHLAIFFLLRNSATQYRANWQANLVASDRLHPK